MHFCILFEIFAPRLLRDRHKSVKTLQNVHFCPDLSIRDATTRNSECTLDPGPSDQNPESPNALNEGHRPSAQTGKGPKRHDSAPSAGNDAKFKRNERGVCSFLHSSKKLFHFVVKSTMDSPYTEVSDPHDQCSNLKILCINFQSF